MLSDPSLVSNCRSLWVYVCQENISLKSVSGPVEGGKRATLTPHHWRLEQYTTAKVVLFDCALQVLQFDTHLDNLKFPRSSPWSLFWGPLSLGSHVDEICQDWHQIEGLNEYIWRKSLLLLYVAPGARGEESKLPNLPFFEPFHRATGEHCIFEFSTPKLGKKH